MEERKQLNVFLAVLTQFQSVGILKEMMLVGSWCLYFYRQQLEKGNSVPTVRTLDLDFLLTEDRRISKEVDIPQLLKQMGFVPSHNRSTGLIVYDHPELRVEFLTPELGRGRDKPQKIEKLNVSAQGLRYLTLLTSHPLVVFHQNLQIQLPQPAAFALHKFIVSSRRLKAGKKEKDLEMAAALLDVLYQKPSEVKRIKSIMKELPKKWLGTILKVSQVHYPRLNKTADQLEV